MLYILGNWTEPVQSATEDRFFLQFKPARYVLCFAKRTHELEGQVNRKEESGEVFPTPAPQKKREKPIVSQDNVVTSVSVVQFGFEQES